MLGSEMMTVLPGWGQGVPPVLVWQGLVLVTSCVPRPMLWQRLAPQAGSGEPLPPDDRGHVQPVGGALRSSHAGFPQPPRGGLPRQGFLERQLRLLTLPGQG